MRVVIVAGEKSGDFLGAQLIKALQARYPGSHFTGIAGPQMMAQGATTLGNMDTLTIFGLDGLFKSLPELFRLRRAVIKRAIEWKADLFVGIDAPDFNHAIEYKLKQAGIPAVHYVSPTVWAWRPKRINKIRRSIDLMLALFPFEKDFYQKHDVPVEFVGHPLANEVANWRISSAFHSQLGDDFVDEGQRLIGVLPGSRSGEVTRLLEPMLRGVKTLIEQDSNLRFVIPAASDKIKNLICRHPAFQECIDSKALKLIDGCSRDLMDASECLILASGTAALEAALFAKPMVVMYKVSKLSALVYEKSIIVDYYSMPNHLTEPPAVKELIQDQATAENLVGEAQRLLYDDSYANNMKDALQPILPSLTADSSHLACSAISDLLSKQTPDK